MERVRNDAIEPLDKGAGRDTRIVGEVAIEFTACLVVITDLPEIARTVAQIGLIHDVGFDEPVAFLAAPCLEIGQRHVHHLGCSHIVDAPVVGQPVGGRDGLQL